MVCKCLFFVGGIAVVVGAPKRGEKSAQTGLEGRFLMIFYVFLREKTCFFIFYYLLWIFRALFRQGYGRGDGQVLGMGDAEADFGDFELFGELGGLAG